MKSDLAVRQFQRDCYAHYLADVQNKVAGFPKPYLYPDGNPIRPVVPVHITQNKLMLVGAFPSARFERRGGKLIPVADNLAPFGPELYFDGFETRVQESTESLYTNYFPQLGAKREDFWITDAVKVYLYPKKHIKNCEALFPRKQFTDTHILFPQVAEASREWLEREVAVCHPKLIITLGEVAARIVSGKTSASNRDLLDGVIRDVEFGLVTKVVHLAHPEIRRVNAAWDRRTSEHLTRLAKEMNQYL